MRPATATASALPATMSADRTSPEPVAARTAPAPAAPDRAANLARVIPAPPVAARGPERPLSATPAPGVAPVLPRNAPAAPAADRPVRLADLAPADRRALPPLRMSMHLFAAAPTERFVILDGQRVGEGDRLGEAVVDEITADGAVLAWRGQRVWISVR